MNQEYTFADVVSGKSPGRVGMFAIEMLRYNSVGIGFKIDVRGSDTTYLADLSGIVFKPCDLSGRLVGPDWPTRELPVSIDSIDQATDCLISASGRSRELQVGAFERAARDSHIKDLQQEILHLRRTVDELMAKGGTNE